MFHKCKTQFTNVQVCTKCWMFKIHESLSYDSAEVFVQLIVLFQLTSQVKVYRFIFACLLKTRLDTHFRHYTSIFFFPSMQWKSHILKHSILFFYFDSVLMYSISIFSIFGYCIVQYVQCIFILWKTSPVLWIPRCMHKSSSFNTDSFLKYRASIIDKKWGSLPHSLFVWECGRCVDAAPCMLLNYKEPSQSSGDNTDLR